MANIKISLTQIVKKLPNLKMSPISETHIGLALYMVSIQCAVCSMQLHIACSVQWCVVCNVQCVVCSVQCVVCSVQ